jgi:coatomer subunit beta
MEDNCTVLLHSSEAIPSIAELRQMLESTEDDKKCAAMKHIITGMLNGERLNNLLMHVIRFACTSNHHQLKKLLMVYWECVDKRDASGKLLPEMILVW